MMPLPRRAVLATLALGLACPAIAVAQAAREGRWIITKAEYPAHILALALAARQSAMMTEVVLERGDIRQVRDYRLFLDGRARKAAGELEKLDLVNAYVNTHVRTVNDFDLYARDNVWSPPINTLTVGGDCEDIAIVKYWGLRRIGFKAEDLYLVLGFSTTKGTPEGHAVLAARLQAGPVAVLDNLERRPVLVGDLKHFEPAYALNTLGFWQVDDAYSGQGEPWRDAFLRAVAARP